MSVSISLFAGAGWQFFDNNGIPLSGGLIYTYAAGTTTPQTTYTTSAGNIANSNPIVLDSAGRTPNEIWLTSTLFYKFLVKTSAGVQIASYDNIGPAADSASLAASSGSSLIGYVQGSSGAVATTVQSKLRESASVLDFGLVANSSGSSAANVTAWGAAKAAATANGFALYFPYGTYYFNDSITLDISTVHIYGDNATLKWTAASASSALQIVSSLGSGYTVNAIAANTTHRISGLTFDCSALTSKINVLLADTNANAGIANTKFDNCVFSVGTTGTGVYLGNQSNFTTFNDCYFYVNVGSGGLSRTNCIGVTQISGTNNGEGTNFTNCLFDSLGIGLQINGGFARLTNCTIDYFSQIGIQQSGAGMVFMANCNMETSAESRWFELSNSYAKLFISNCRLDFATSTWASSDHIIEAYGGTSKMVVIDGLHISCTAAFVSAYTPTYIIGAVAGTAGKAEAYGITSEDTVSTLVPITPANLLGPYNFYVGAGMSVGGATPGASGVAFPASQVAVSNANTLDDYDEYTAASTACTGAITVAVIWQLTKVGNVVTLTLPNVYQTSPTAAASFIFGLALPVKYRPTVSKYWLVQVEDNSAILANPGSIVINASNGSITCYKSATQTGNWTASGLGGLDSTAISWTI